MSREQANLKIPIDDNSEQLLNTVNKFISSLAEYNVIEHRVTTRKVHVISFSFDLDESNTEITKKFYTYMNERNCLFLYKDVEKYFLKSDIAEEIAKRKEKADSEIERIENRDKIYRERYEVRGKRKRNNSIYLKVDDVVFNKFNELLNESGMNKTDLISYLILKGRVNCIDTSNLEECIKSYIIELKEQGNNINQIAYHLNTGHNISNEQVKKVLSSFRKAQENFNAIQEQINEIYSIANMRLEE